MTQTLPALLTDLATEQDHRAGLHARLARLFDLREHGVSTRAAVENFIRDCFAQMHGARIQHFMPRLLSLHAGRGEVVAAFGLREAADSRLFLESYLDRPIEDVLKARLGRQVRREEIIEVGNLSARYPGAARWLIVALTALLHEAGYRWVVFTGTAALRNGFHKVGLRPIKLGAATLQHLPPSERADWGRYYESSPLVMAGDIAYGYHTLLLQHELFQTLRAGIVPVDGVNEA
jgi:hypothetical protein